MSLKQIDRIKNFGIFEKFEWDQNNKSFKSFNVIYGWNYSGKTTLSRIFRCFEIGSLHIDYPDAKFQVQSSEGNRYTESTLNNVLTIKVFNTDFILNNLKWDDSDRGIEPILLIGQQNIKLQEELDKEKENIEKYNAKLLDVANLKRLLSEKISNALTEKAGIVRNSLSIPGYNKTHILPIIETIAKQSGTINLLNEDEIIKLIEIFKSIEKRSLISTLELKIPDISLNANNANILLNYSIKSKIIEKLKNDNELNAWVKKGLELHQGKTTCEFCDGILPSNLLEKFSEHFSKDYEILLNKIDDQIRENESNKVTLALPEFGYFYTEFQKKYNELKELLSNEIQNLNLSLTNINESLKLKKKKPFESPKKIEIDNNNKRIEAYLGEINQLILKHNSKTENIGIEKDKAYNILLQNYASEFIKEQNYLDALTKIKDFEEEALKLKDSIKLSESKIKSIENQLSETVKGAEKINEYLSQYFGKEDIKVKVTLENKFQLFRSSNRAKNLSEGEKTAIAFAYFITKLEDKNSNISNTIVYIDDPISSLDSNHLFNTYALIRDKFYYRDETTKKHVCKVAQLFISTHNYEFLNLLKDWLKKTKEGNHSMYLIERINNNSVNNSIIKNLPKEIFQFKSEYVYLFSLIYSFKLNPTTDFSYLYNLPNIIRRFLETFSAFKYLSSINVDEDLNLLIKNSVQCERVRKFVHYYSHSINTNKLLQFSDPTECKDVVDIILDSIRTLDEDHYNSLLKEIQELNPSINA